MTYRKNHARTPTGKPSAPPAVGGSPTIDALSRAPGSRLRAVGAWLYVKYRATRLWGHRWLVDHPAIHDTLRATGALRPGVEPVARGIAIGLFIGLTPTVGVQIMLMIAACVALRGNFLAAFAVSFISNPFTLPLLYWIFHALGAGVLELAGFTVVDDASTALNGFGDEVLSAAIGSLMIATPAALTGYFATHWLAGVREKIRRRKKMAA